MFKFIQLMLFQALGFYVIFCLIARGDNEHLKMKSLEVVATPESNFVAAGDEVVINIIVMNLGKTPETLLLPRGQTSGFDCIGSYFSATEGGFWRSAELQLFRGTTSPKIVELTPGAAHELKIQVNLFDRTSDQRAFCLFSIVLLGLVDNDQSLASNEIVVWNSSRPKPD